MSRLLYIIFRRQLPHPVRQWDKETFDQVAERKTTRATECQIGAEPLLEKSETGMTADDRD